MFGVRGEADGKRVLFFVDHQGSDSGEIIDSDVIYLKSNTDFDEAGFSWSLCGRIWNETSYRYTLKFGNWRGNRVGLACWNPRTDDSSKAGWIDVDYFRYSPSSRQNK